MAQVACVGILVADVMVRPVDKIPGKGLLEQVDSIEMYTGGNAMTATVNLQTLGTQSAIIGKVGTDVFGDFLEKEFQKRGIDTRGLVKDPNTQTSVSVVLSDRDGERSFLHCVGANGTFCLDDVNWEVIEEAEIVFVTGSFLMNTFDGEQTRLFLKKCKELGKTTLLDVCWDAKGQWGKVLDPCMPYIDIFMPSIDEAVQLTGEKEPPQIADVFFAKGVGKVVIKWGKRGCYARESVDAEGVVLPTLEKMPVVDTTGAGDSFCSGFLAALARGKSFLECCAFANATGSVSVSAKGATTAMRSYEEVEKIRKEYE